MSMLTPRGVGGHSPVRRKRRHHPVRIMLALLLIAAIATVGWFYVLRDDATIRTTTAAPVRSCPAPSAIPSAVPAAQVKLNVFNATERRGLAATVATQLRKRGFRVAKVSNDPAKRTVTGVAEVRTSMSGAAAARTVGAQVDSFVTVPDQRRDASVDLVIGAAFKRLRTAAQATAALRATPEPSPTRC